jgi:hypothetical protein
VYKMAGGPACSNMTASSKQPTTNRSSRPGYRLLEALHSRACVMAASRNLVLLHRMDGTSSSTTTTSSSSSSNTSNR